jgi:hypothetical protein
MPDPTKLLASAVLIGTGATARLHSLVTHAFFGLGLYATGRALA